MAGRHTELRTTTSVETDEAILLNPDSVANSDDLVVIDASSRDHRAVFRTRHRNKPLEPKSWIKVHPNTESLFGGDFPSNVIISGEEEARRQLVVCDQMEVFVQEKSRTAVERYFNQKRLVHPMEEVRTINGSEITFRVSETHPHSPGNTYLVDPEETSIEFSSEPESSEVEEESTSGGGDGEIGEPYSTRLEDVELDDVVGLQDVKDHAVSLVNLYNDGTYKDLTDKYEGLVSKRGSVLLYGPPGCGKTMIAKAIGNMFVDKLDRDVVFMQVTGSNVLSKYQGQSEQKVRKIFEDARKKAGENGFAFVFIDEVENLVTDRNADSVQSSRASITNEFLAQMTSLEENVMIIGATNLPFKIDPAASRRFHTKLFCGHPDPDGMSRKWEKSLEDVDLKDSNIDYDRLGQKSEAFTPAEIDNRILGSEVQTEIIGDYLDGSPRRITEEYLVKKVEKADKRTIPEYVAKIAAQLQQQQLSGYTELKNYIKDNQHLVRG